MCLASTELKLYTHTCVINCTWFIAVILHVFIVAVDADDDEDNATTAMTMTATLEYN